MATYSELYAQLKNDEYLIYLGIDRRDMYKRVATYVNLAGSKGTLGALCLGAMNLTFDDLPVIVSAEVFANGINASSAAGGVSKVQLDVIYNTIDSKVDSSTSKVFRYKGAVETAASLPSENNTVGDVYQVISEGYTEYVWVDDTTPHWDILGSPGGGGGGDLSNYYTKAETDQLVSNLGITVDKALLKYNQDFTAFEVHPTSEAIPAGTVDSVTGLTYNTAVPAQMTHRTLIRSCTPIADSDLVVDWGDDSSTTVSELPSGNAKLDDTEYIYLLEHTYTTPGRYIVKIYGRKYFGFTTEWNTSRDNLAYNLMSRCLEQDLPLASHLTNIASFAALTLRLQKVVVSENILTNAFNLSSMFLGDSNLVSVTGIKNISNACRTTSAFFAECTSLETTDFIIPGMTKDGSLFYIFSQNGRLNKKIEKLFPTNGFSGISMNVDHAFFGNASLTGTVPAHLLWENTNITWKNASNTFTGCSAEIRAQVPTSWGGTNAEIEAKLVAGYWNKVVHNDVKVLQDEIDELRSAISGQTSVEFITGGTEQSPVAVNLNSKKWFIATTPFTGILPESPEDGTIIRISIVDGQNGMVINASGNDTIEGENKPCALGITADGIYASNVTSCLVYRSGNWILF